MSNLNRLILFVVFGFCFITAAQAQTYTMLYNFTGQTDGGEPVATLLQDTAGNLYGTTVLGGNVTLCPGPFPAPGCGTVFKVSTAGSESVLYGFKGFPDGSGPESAVLYDSGYLYGTTTGGGTGVGIFGTIFRVNPSGESVVYSFTGAPDGSDPQYNLIKDAANNIYGVTRFGGVDNQGTVFKLDASGTETILYSFKSGTDGAVPSGGLLRDSAGNLYGTTAFGGNQGCGGSGCGTIFRLDTADNETVLYRFAGAPDGSQPSGPLISDGHNFYGVADSGGTGTGCGANGCGTIFKLSTSGKETTLYSFTGGSDGANPTGGVIHDAAGNLYGVAFSGGPSCGIAGGCGTVFELSPSGTLTVLHSFTGPPDGQNPSAGLIRDAAGDLYGTTPVGGSGGGNCSGSSHIPGCGIVFKLTP